MRKKTALVVALCAVSLFLFAQKPLINLRYEQNYTPTYDEVIEMFQLLDSKYENATFVENGFTDIGKPLHTFVINSEPEFNPETIKAQGKSVLLINNGIHPGEPEGIDASLQFADDILRNKNGMQKWLDNTVIVIIPVYNIAGHLNRGKYNRANQATPYETGFRGNAKNLDLNRDFSKCDSENARSINKIFNQWDPDVFLDTHTTNGSDHQYSVTWITPFPDYFPPAQEQFLRSQMIPDMFEKMDEGEYKLTPYVNWLNYEPLSGILLWQDSPRYSSGYASLFNSYGMMTENHVYKDFADRVKSCYQFIVALSEFTSENSEEIISSRKQGTEELLAMKTYPISYKVDTSSYSTFTFDGYETSEEIIDKVTGLPRFGYDRSKPLSKEIRYYDSYNTVEEITVPEYYVLPQGWIEVIERLQLNGIEMAPLKNDTIMEVTVDYIDEYSSPKNPFNGHYFHNEVTTRSEVQQINYYAGDLLIPVRQNRMKYILEMLEPKAMDSFFRWNFFDSILDQREYFSSYGFEENALKYLNEHPEFKKQLEEKRKADPEFAKNHRAQLSYIYNNTEWAEKTFKRYPVAKIY
ncbi:M14 family zinc carboxypeptidase [uncultured Draconibacterium sp.]|uniref:M14 family zinc carboxypeptidase n=1 Tax=uncultured Draconibacterium sp. TaxID=1573823 RepID=UPI0025E04522|nr:M14 family zinc carboxypeptidase [uncultured Draconibacterium sp.]